jgi:hypothetical protein
MYVHNCTKGFNIKTRRTMLKVNMYMHKNTYNVTSKRQEKEYEANCVICITQKYQMSVERLVNCKIVNKDCF